MKCPRCGGDAVEQGVVIFTCHGCGLRWPRYPGDTEAAYDDAVRSARTLRDSNMAPRVGTLRPGEAWPNEVEERMALPIVCPQCKARGLAAPGTTVRCPFCNNTIEVRRMEIT